MEELRQIPVYSDIICFWKQNDLGVYGRRADRWIQYWAQHPDVKRVWIIEPTAGRFQLTKMLETAASLNRVEASEFIILLSQMFRKTSGQCDTSKLRYLSRMDWNQQQSITDMNLLKETLDGEGVINPMVVLWPLCPVPIESVERLKPAFILTDIVDDQREFKSNQSRLSLIQKQYDELLSRSDLVISNSLTLVGRLEEEFNRFVKHVPNEWLPKAAPSDGVSASQVFALEQRLSDIESGPVAGYVGNLRERIDVERMVGMINQHPEWNFWFVGQAYRSAFYERASGLPNCTFFGSMQRDLALTVLARFDVALVPFSDDALTRSMSLLKLEEYDAFDLPVIDFRLMGDVQIAQMLDAISAPPGKKAKRGNKR